MKRIILILLTLSLCVCCGSIDYNEDFVGVWKHQQNRLKAGKITIEKADDNQLRLIVHNSGSRQTLIMEFIDDNTIQSVQNIFGTKLIYKLIEEDGKTVLQDYILNYKYNKLD